MVVDACEYAGGGERFQGRGNARREPIVVLNVDSCRGSGVVSVMEKVRWCQLVAKAADDDDCGGDYLGTPTMAILEAEDDEDMPLLPESLTCRGGELPPYHRDSLRG
ncbi:hypothetical protein OsI_01649 [Oryza sativa Indica Group]|uniref:Uncharacterized protein n=1 Tax=Oryza sativa subsp. indica TaxID=39946 RepID=B8A740_ORYSI|nr:hypothetical protein OsI_01649 [Oryza sativa Indica Group]